MVQRSKIGITLAALCTLGACGGSDSNNEPALESIQAQLNEDTSWQQAVNFNGTPIVITAPQHGEVSVGAALVTYTPNQDFNGADSVLIEAGNTRYSISFDVAPVNDAPRITQSLIEVAAENRIDGQINAEDIDGDTLTFELIEAPETGSLTLANDGAFTLEIDTLTLPNQSFKIAVSDGIAETKATIQLKPAYTTNAEKAAYYYRSDKSHLKNAEAKAATINDDILAAPAYSAIAQGYAKAALQTEVDRIFDDHIRGQEATARALQDLAKAYEQGNDQETANRLRRDALNAYAQFIADNGLANISATDASFLLTLLNQQVNANDNAGAEQTIQQLNLYTSTIGGANTEYSTAYGRLVTAYRNQVSAAIEAYQQQRDNTSRNTALAAIDRFSGIVASTGFQTLTRGDLAGERAYKLAPLYSATAVGYYISIGELEAARTQLAETISYYTAVDYDSELAREAKPYAANSLQDYTFPLVDAAAAFAILYPERPSSENVPFNLIPSDSVFFARAQTAISGASALAGILNGGSVQDAIAQLRNDFADDLRELQTQLTQNTVSSPYLGAQLLALGYEAEAAVAFAAGLEVLTSSAYIAENGGATLYTTGTRGCLKFVQLYQSVDSLDANDAAQACESMATTYFTAVEGDVSVADVVNAHIDAVTAWQAVDANQRALNVLESLRSRFAELATDSEEQFEFWVDYAQVSAHSGAYAVAFDAVETLLNLASNESLSNLARTEQLIAVANLLASLETTNAVLFDRLSLLERMRRVAYNDDDYASLMQRAELLNEVVSSSLATALRATPAADALDLAEDFVRAMSSLRKYSLAGELLAELPLGAAERLTYGAIIAQTQALQDDFPASLVASVDTDSDGLANFLAVNASPEQLEANDIATDNDADNDGVEDANDPTPLG